MSIVITVIIITVNLVPHELVILMGKNGYVRIIFEIKILVRMAMYVSYLKLKL